FSADLLTTLMPERRKAKTFATIIRQIDSLAGNKPMLILIEDIQWADPSTLELLDRLIEIVERRPILLVVTARPEVRPAWAARPHVTVQLLSGLDRSTAVTLIKQIAGPHELHREIIDRIVAHADSVPLFIEELTKTVLKTIEDNKRNDLATESLSSNVVPRSLHSSLMSRLDRVSRGKEIAQIGAVIGREFSFDLVQAVSAFPARQLEKTLTELAQAEIIVAHGQP